MSSLALPLDLLALSINHTTAPVALRERVSIPADRVGPLLADLRSSAGVREAAVLSTCNRTELYCVLRGSACAELALAQWFAKSCAVPWSELSRHLHFLEGERAVRHVFRVASGLDSVVLGESQIFGQMKEAASRAQQVGALGTQLNQLFQRAFCASKEVRTRTRIGEGSLSMPAGAVRLVRGVFPELLDKRVLFLGAGEMSTLALPHFAALRPRDLVIASRRLEPAQRLAERHGAAALPWEAMAKHLHQFDVVVGCTRSEEPVVTLAMATAAAEARAKAPMVFVDLALPRDVAAGVSAVPGMTVFTLDDVARVVQSGVSSRSAARDEAEGLVDRQVSAYMRWLAARRSVPLLRTLEERAQGARDVELERAKRLLASGACVDEVLAGLANRLSNKLMHAPRRLIATASLSAEDEQRLLRLYDRGGLASAARQAVDPAPEWDDAEATAAGEGRTGRERLFAL